MRLIPVVLLCATAAHAECLNPQDITQAMTNEGLYFPHPEPALESEWLRGDGVREFRYSHATDGWWDSPGFQGLDHPFAVTTPPGWQGEPLPLRVVLHGGCGGFEDALGQMPDELTHLVAYLDDRNPGPTGSGCAVPGRVHHVGYFSSHEPGVTGTAGVFVPYTMRRQLWQVGYILSEFGADPGAVHVVGHSKGGAGALYHALLAPGLYASVFADVPRVNFPRSQPPNLQPCHVTGNGWLDELDTAHLQEREPMALDVLTEVWFGRDDRSARWCYAFGACSGVQQGTTGRWVDRFVSQLLVWDESGHDRGRFGICSIKADTPDPVLGCRWHDTGWSAVGKVRSDVSWPAFSGFSADQDFGGWVDDVNCPRDVAVAGDTACINGGDLAGARGRGLRWQHVQEAPGFWAVTYWIESSSAPGIEGANCQAAEGYPYCFDQYRGGNQTVTITPRRLQSFAPAVGESVQWSVLEKGVPVASGSAVVAADGIHVPVPVGTVKSRLRVVWK